ncbi:TPA: hypothetical protein DF272_06725 [Candidatus Falkowbacteria bacterium]|nr:hypothetical protein [Candidatus Falkowbacteria bacterium]
MNSLREILSGAVPSDELAAILEHNRVEILPRLRSLPPATRVVLAHQHGLNEYAIASTAELIRLIEENGEPPTKHSLFRRWPTCARIVSIDADQWLLHTFAASLDSWLERQYQRLKEFTKKMMREYEVVVGDESMVVFSDLVRHDTYCVGRLREVKEIMTLLHQEGLDTLDYGNENFDFYFLGVMERNFPRIVESQRVAFNRMAARKQPDPHSIVLTLESVMS